jgi:thymidine phosphorylase
VGDYVKAGEALFTVHADDADKLAQAKPRLLDAVVWSDTACEPLPLFYGVVD